MSLELLLLLFLNRLSTRGKLGTLDDRIYHSCPSVRAPYLLALTFTQCTLLVLIDFCPVWRKFFTWSSVTKTFDNLSEIIIEYQI